MIETPTLVTTTACHYAAIAMVVPSAEIGQHIGAAIAEITGALKRQQLTPTGPWFSHHHRPPTDTFDFEVCFPIAQPIAPEGRVRPGLWPATHVARTVYAGNYTHLPHAWGDFRKWINTQGLASREEFWEVYTVNPNDTPDPSQWRTHLNWALA